MPFKIYRDDFIRDFNEVQEEKRLKRLSSNYNKQAIAYPIIEPILGKITNIYHDICKESSPFDWGYFISEVNVYLTELKNKQLYGKE